MTLPEAIKLLENYQKWRRGAEIPQPNPWVIGEAIDVLIKKVNENICTTKRK